MEIIENVFKITITGITQFEGYVIKSTSYCSSGYNVLQEIINRIIDAGKGGSVEMTFYNIKDWRKEKFKVSFDRDLLIQSHIDVAECIGNLDCGEICFNPIIDGHCYKEEGVAMCYTYNNSEHLHI